MASSSSSRRWASVISWIASRLHFLIIVLQVPLFRVPCRTGICTSPLVMSCSQLVSTELIPAFVVKPLLFSGAIAKAYIRNSGIINYDQLMKQYHFNNLEKTPATSDLQHLEVLAGCYLSVAGAILGVLSPGRISLFGALLIIWGFVREVILTKPAALSPMKTIHIYPALYVTALCAFLSIRKDVRKLIRCFRPRRVAKSMRSKLKNM